MRRPESSETQNTDSRKWLTTIAKRISPYAVFLGLTFFIPDPGINVNGGKDVSKTLTSKYKIETGGYANLSNGAVVKDDPVMGEAEVMKPSGEYTGTDSSDFIYIPDAQVSVSYRQS